MSIKKDPLDFTVFLPPSPDNPSLEAVSSPGRGSRGGSWGKISGSGSVGTAGGGSAAELEEDRMKTVASTQEAGGKRPRLPNSASLQGRHWQLPNFQLHLAKSL